MLCVAESSTSNGYSEPAEAPKRINWGEILKNKAANDAKKFAGRFSEIFFVCMSFISFLILHLLCILLGFVSLVWTVCVFLLKILSSQRQDSLSYWVNNYCD